MNEIKGGRKKNPNLTENKNIRFESDIYEVIQAAAKEQNQDTAQYIREILKAAVNLDKTPTYQLSERKQFIPAPGIYIVKSGDRVLYVGQTVNLYQRWQNHHRLNDILVVDPEASLHFVSINTNDSSLLLEIERNFIEQLQPELNEESGRPAGSNLTKSKPIRFDQDVYEFIQTLAKSQNQDTASYIRYILRDWMHSQISDRPALEVAEVSNIDLMIKLERMESMLTSLTKSNSTFETNTSKKINNSKILVLDNDAKEFLIQKGIVVDSTKEIILEGAILIEFENKFGLVEDLEELPF